MSAREQKKNRVARGEKTKEREKRRNEAYETKPTQTKKNEHKNPNV